MEGRTPGVCAYSHAVVILQLHGDCTRAEGRSNNPSYGKLALTTLPYSGSTEDRLSHLQDREHLPSDDLYCFRRKRKRPSSPSGGLMKVMSPST